VDRLLHKVSPVRSSADDLKTKAIGAFRRLQKLPHLVRGFFADPKLHYITA
jgi:hypothetical protein